MDSRTAKLLQQVNAYLESPPHGVPDQLVEQITNTRDMLQAPRYTDESPGQREAREVAEAHMPEEVAKKYFGGQSQEEAQSANVGVLQASE